MAEVVDAKKGQGGDGTTLATMVDKTHEVIPCEYLEEEKIPGSRVRFKLKIGEDVIQPRLKQTIREYSRQISIPGFRPGKAPEHLVRRRFEGPAREETVKRLVPRLSEQFASDRSYEVISEPYLLALKVEDKDGAFVEIALEVHPNVEVAEDKLKDITVEAHRVPIDEAYLTKVIDGLRAENADYEPTEEGFKKGDALLFNCTVADANGDIIADRTALDYYCTNAEEDLPTEVAEALVGKKKGETVELKVTEVTDLGTEEVVDYKVEILEIKARVLPDLDDDFARDVSEEYESVADLKADIEKRAGKGEENRQRQEAANEILSVLRERLEFDLPRGMVDTTARRNIYNMEQNLNQHGLSLRNLDSGMVERYTQGTFGQARINVKNSLIIRALGRYFDLEPKEDQIKAKLEEVSERTGRKPLAIRAQLEAKKEWGAFVDDLRVELVLDKLIEQSTVNFKDTTIEELQAIQRERQERQAAILRGELQAVAEADKKYFQPDEKEDEMPGMELATEEGGNDAGQ
ncbi:MAG: trigger factor [Candidatus Sumerlaeia bacterium]|nr:trigger factor [Candidatus Sumerlaeia bacterium]